MKFRFFRLNCWTPAWLTISVLLCGCDAKIEQFPSNDVYSLTLARSRSTPTSAARTDVTTAVNELFGTPDSPRWPAALQQIVPQVDPENIKRTAGPFSSQRDGTHVGMYREHCVTCHGLAGSGAGPASQLQSPYPRDYRHGVFKWKSTERNAKPIRADLRNLLLRGVPGTGMPSFVRQDPADIEALIDYVIFLSVRGEVERELLAAAIDELDYGQEPPEPELRIGGGTVGDEVIREVVAEIGNSWADAEAQIVPVPKSDAVNNDASITRGRAIFHGPIANCAACHGRDGDGQAGTLDYDDWTKEYSTRIGLTPTDGEAMRPFREAGALRPRVIQPRRLKAGVFRGGGDEQTLYRRIITGIAGTPMPAVPVVDQESGAGLTTKQVWDLVHFVQSLQDQP